jgi:hypothetical protein
MGQGEYGGNGSVHYYGTHKKDRNHGHSDHNYHEVDEVPNAGGYFTVTVLDVAANAVTYNSITKTLTVTVPIKHDPSNYTRQVLIEWPNT